jgi:hypothetical protein
MYTPDAMSWASASERRDTHPNAFVQSRDWDELPHPPSSWLHVMWTVIPVSTLSDRFGLGVPAIAGEERFRSPTDFKSDELEVMGFQRLGIGREGTPIRLYRECTDGMSGFPFLL